MVARVDTDATAYEYEYIGPADLLAQVDSEPTGRRVRTPADFAAWVAEMPSRDLAEPFTFVIDLLGRLRLAPRRSEHVACAGGQRVLSAGEIGFARLGNGWAVIQVSNQSTGYCPDLESWNAVAAALDAIGLDRPAGFTHEVVFRRCPGCAELNVVKENFFVCAFCEGELPPEWNACATVDEAD
jgi:hypothetical protein